ncbi:uncharacterized protein LOC34620456 [Cyclospora cayetanensis]|uniref:Uncharacterized protein LOC34620456 n=1 Tax=Cyclospora cayetanensis TaxID=88456 RepID=A0A6P6RSL0_9EIME|nr:uncharacterized protein LOC34620456 [Cyclospora cayetanensis]
MGCMQHWPLGPAIFCDPATRPEIPASICCLNDYKTTHATAGGAVLRVGRSHMQLATVFRQCSAVRRGPGAATEPSAVLPSWTLLPLAAHTPLQQRCLGGDCCESDASRRRASPWERRLLRGFSVACRPAEDAKGAASRSRSTGAPQGAADAATQCISSGQHTPLAAAAQRAAFKVPAAAAAASQTISQLRRQHPAAFAAVAAACAGGKADLRLLQDPLWLAALGIGCVSRHVSQHSSSPESVPCVNVAWTADASEGENEEAEDGAVAAACMAAAAVAGEQRPLLRLHAAALLGEAAALLHALGRALGSSLDAAPSEGAPCSAAAGGRPAPCTASAAVFAGERAEAAALAAAAEDAGNGLDFWQLRMQVLPFSLSLLTLRAKGAAPWRAQPCSGLSGVHATQVQQPLAAAAAAEDALLLQQQLQSALRLVAKVATFLPQHMHPIQLRCLQALQQAEQLTAFVALQGCMQTNKAVSSAAVATESEATLSDSRLPAAAPLLQTRPLPVRLGENAVAQRVLGEADDRTVLEATSPVADVVSSAAAGVFFCAVGVNDAGEWLSQDWYQPQQQQSLQELMKRMLLPQDSSRSSTWSWTLQGSRRRGEASKAALSRGIFLPTVSASWRNAAETPFVATASAEAAMDRHFLLLLQHAAVKLHSLLTARVGPALAVR